MEEIQEKFNSQDHDLLVTLISEVRQIREQLRELSDNTKAQIIDHEQRIRDLEASKWKIIGICISINFILVVCGIMATVYFH